MKNKWEIAYFIINAKKCIDSLIFISENEIELSNIDLRERTDRIKQNFYINLANVLDELFNTKSKKKEICDNDIIIHNIYYERDKHSAHKDDDYIPKKYNSLKEEIDEKKNELEHTKDLCKSILPINITLDYVSHDKELFRLINRINAELECDVNKIKYPNATLHSYQLSEEGRHAFNMFDTEKHDRETAKIFGFDYDEVITKIPLKSTEDIKNMNDEEKNRYAIIIENGINFNEGLQNRQDSCIKMNLLYNLDTWCTPNLKELKKIKLLKKIGYLDKYEIPHPEVLKDENKLIEINKIFTKF